MSSRQLDSTQPDLFSSYQIRNTEFRNRLWVSPMCQYSAVDGVPNDWHLVHLAQFASGGAGLIFTEATGVSPEARISVECPGIWNKAQAVAWERIVQVVHRRGGKVGMQLGHAGRKASTSGSFRSTKFVDPSDGGWVPEAATKVPYNDESGAPRAMSADDIDRVVEAFVMAARRAVEAGFDAIEIHAAHGYLLHQFLSPLTNTRSDEYGGSFENRSRFVTRIVEEIRREFDDLPLFVRLSATDWAEGGWGVDDTARLAGRLIECGADLIDVSAGGLVPGQAIPTLVTGYQLSYARSVREKAGVPVAGVGLLNRSHDMQEALRRGDVDVVFAGRQFLRDPYSPLRFAAELGQEIEWPEQYRQARYDRIPVTVDSKILEEAVQR